MRVLRLLLTFLVLDGGVHAVAWACSCAASTESTQALYAASDLVFWGEVTRAVQPLSLGCVQSTADPLLLGIEVIEAFKGVDEDDVITLETAVSGASCGLGVDAGDMVILYLDEDAEYIGLCAPHTVTDDPDHPELDELRALAEG